MFHSLVLWHMLFYLPVVPFSPIPVFIQKKILFKHPNIEMKHPILSCNLTRSDYSSFPFHCQVISSAFHYLFISVSNWGMGFFFYFGEKIYPLTSIMIYVYVLYHSLYTLLCLVDCHVWLLMTPWTVAFQAPLSMGILQARILEPFPPPGDLPNPGIEPKFLTLQADSLLSEPPGKLVSFIVYFSYLYIKLPG